MRLSLLLEALNLRSLYMPLSSLSVASKHISKMYVSGVTFVLSGANVVYVFVLQCGKTQGAYTF